MKRSSERSGVVSARVYDYEGEGECDLNTELFLSSIDAASKTGGIVAVKMTALGKPVLLTKMSELLNAIRTLWWERFAQDSQRDRTRTISLEEFRMGLELMGAQVDDESSQKLFNTFDKQKTGEIDYLEWTDTIDLEFLTTRAYFPAPRSDSPEVVTRSGALPLLTNLETVLMDNMVTRLNRIGEAAFEKKVRLMVDAEQTYMQPAIDHFTRMMQRKHNTDFPTIFNTYQCYLKGTFDHLKNNVERARRDGYFFAVKLVRGAYMVQEREIATNSNVESPVWDIKAETDENYDRCLDYLIDKLHKGHLGNLVVASHNQNSIEHAIAQIDKLKLDHLNQNSAVYFAQLLGMADHLSMPLGNHGFKVFKYVPYGPIAEVLPYLVRRAQENASLLDNLGSEAHMINEELMRRLKRKK